MKRFTAITAAGALVLCLLLNAFAAPQNYEGTWLLNRAKSEGLTGGLANADVIMVVTQNQKELTVDQIIRIRGHKQPSQPLTYRLDGKESTADVVRPLAGSMKLKARFIETGKILELNSTIDGENQGKPTSVMTREFWELVAGGKALKITRIRETPEKTQQFKLYFERQK